MSNFINELMNGDHKKFLFEVVLLRNGMNVYEKYANDEPCCICWESLKNKYTYELKCQHAYHRNCMLTNLITYNRGGCEICKVKDPAKEA